MNYWDSVGRWINTLLLFIVGVVSFDTLFRLLEAQESNVLVGGVRLLSGLALIPFQGMFSEQEYVKTAAMAVLGYAMLVGISLAVLRSLQATRPARRQEYGYERQRQPARVARQPDPRRQASAARPVTQRTAATRTEPRSAPRKPATRTPAPRQKPAQAPRPQQPEATRNGRSSGGQNDTPPKSSADSRGDAAPKGDGVAGRGDATSKAPLAATDVKAAGAGSAAPTPKARTPGKASRGTKRVDSDGSSDD
jgi:hypothetical protein